MENPHFFSYMVAFIKDHDYPLVHSMNTEEIAQVFHGSNRCFLISWALILLDEDCYGKFLKGREQDKCLLAELVYCHGFCTASEKLGFVNGDLSLEEQVQILYKMFKFIEHETKAIKMEDTGQIALEDLHLLKNKDLNLFPAFGDIKTISEEERKSKIKEVRRKTAKLKLEQVSIKKDGNSQGISKAKKEHIRDIINGINENLSQFNGVVKVIGKEVSSKDEPNYVINPISVELLKSCTEYLKIVTQFIADLKTINEFVIEDLQITNNDISQYIEMLTKQMQDMGL